MTEHAVLAPGVAEQVEHLYGATLEDLLEGRLAPREPEPAPVAGVTSTDLEVGTDPSVRMRRYERASSSGRDRPCVVWVHGGAWVAGDLDMAEAEAPCRRWADRLDAVVYSVDYRLAPASTYPAAMDDVVAAFHAARLDPAVDARRVLLGGASAGGNLVAAASQQLRDAGTAPPSCVLLAYPATDPVGGPYARERPAVCPELLWFDQSTIAGAFSLYLGDASPARYATPADGDLIGLPPTLVTTSAIDSLEAQALRYVELLRAADVDVTHHRVERLLHGYLGMVGSVAAADDAFDRHTRWIASRLGVVES
jgi:acetyl esterase/lipase